MSKTATAESTTCGIRDRVRELRRVRAGDLVPNPSNFRRHPENQRHVLDGVLHEIGYADALLVREREDGRLELIDGHLRAETTPDMVVPVLVVDLTEAEAKRLLVHLDPLASMAQVDDAVLKELLGDIGKIDDSLAAELAATERWLEEAMSEGGEEVDAPEAQIDRAEELQKEWKTELGQLWAIPGKAGEHRLLCGDSTKRADVERLVGTTEVILVHADPPYGMGKEKEGIANDNLYREKLDAFQMSWWQAVRPSVADNGSAYIWGNAEDLWRLWYCGGLKDSERLTFRNDIVWLRGPSAGPGGSGIGSEGQRLYVPATEHILFFMLGEQGFNINADNYWEGWEPIRAYLDAEREKCGWGPEDIKRITGVGMYCHWFTRSQWCFIPEEHYNTLQAAAREHDAFKREHDELKREHDELKREHDELKREFYSTRAYFDNTHENMTDVWDFPRVTGEERHDHPTPKPVAMVQRIVKTSSELGDVILDPFLGSGTTMVAAEQLGRVCYGIEISPAYTAVALQRMKDMGLEPRLA